MKRSKIAKRNRSVATKPTEVSTGYPFNFHKDRFGSSGAVDTS